MPLLPSALLPIAVLAGSCIAAQAAPPLLASGPARTAAQEAANTQIALDFHLTMFGDRDFRQAASRYLATDFRNHDVEEPSGAADYANYFLNPAAYGNPHPPSTTKLPATAMNPLFAITDNDLTMIARDGFDSELFETRNGHITQIWHSGTESHAMLPDQPDTADGETIGPLQVAVDPGTATRTQRDANRALVESFIQNFFVEGDAAAAAADLSPTLHSHIPGVPSGAGFALVARKHPDKVTVPNAQIELFALAQGELVAIGFPVPYAGDPGAQYAQNIARVQNGKITDWWFSGTPAGPPHYVWKMPVRTQAAK